MLRSPAGNMTGVQPAPPVIPVKQGTAFPLEEILSLETIRHHTKTEDIPSVLDSQLELYRQAAFEAAERHTKRLFTRNMRMEEIVPPPRRQTHDIRRMHRYTLRYVPAENYVFLNGAGTSQMLPVEQGKRRIEIPAHLFSSLMFDCCREGATGASAMRVIYLAGYPSPDAIEAGIKVGVLKYIAWNVANPGDVLKSVDDKNMLGESFLKGSNDTAWASGAIDEWRRYVDEV